jgi:hypothetical protein
LSDSRFDAPPAIQFLRCAQDDDRRPDGGRSIKAESVLAGLTLHADVDQLQQSRHFFAKNLTFRSSFI